MQESAPDLTSYSKRNAYFFFGPCLRVVSPHARLSAEDRRTEGLPSVIFCFGRDVVSSGLLCLPTDCLGHDSTDPSHFFPCLSALSSQTRNLRNVNASTQSRSEMIAHCQSAHMLVWVTLQAHSEYLYIFLSSCVNLGMFKGRHLCCNILPL